MRTKIKNIIVICATAAIMLSISISFVSKDDLLYSDAERRPLATLPEANSETIFSGKFMENFELYAQDQFPLREKFRSLKAITSSYFFSQLDNNDIYLADGHLSKLEFPQKDSMIDNATDRFSFVYNTYMANKNMNIYFSIIPDKNYFLASDNNRLSLDYEQFISCLLEKTRYMQYIDIVPLLELNDYYSTDTHWRQEKILDVAEKIANTMGADFDTEDFIANTLDHPFYGVYHGQAALPIAPDEISYLTTQALDKCTAISFDTGTPQEIPIYDMEKAFSRDPYEMFLSGPSALIQLDNPNALTEKELIIFCDSFGSSLTPLLLTSYAKIYVVDLRYIQSSMLDLFIEFKNQDVLFIYSTMLLNNSLALK